MTVISDNNGTYPEFDTTSKGITILQSEHHEVHEGHSFFTFKSATINAAQTISITFKTPDSNKLCHMLGFVRANNEANFKVIEAPTVTAGTGTQLSIFNRNRSLNYASSVSDMSVTPAVGYATSGATYAGGTTIYEEQFASARGAAVTRAESEIVLASNTIYTFLLTSEATGNDCEIMLSWYEHDPNGE